MAERGARQPNRHAEAAVELARWAHHGELVARRLAADPEDTEALADLKELRSAVILTRAARQAVDLPADLQRRCGRVEMVVKLAEAMVDEVVADEVVARAIERLREG